MIEDYDVYQISLYCAIFALANALFLVNFSNNANFKLVFSIVCAFSIGIMFGIRSDNIGLDSKNYADFFNGVDLIQGSPGFRLMAILFRSLFSDYSLFFIAISVFSNAFMVLGLRFFTKDYLFIYGLLLTSFSFLNMHINIVRQGLAVSLIVFSTGLIISRRYIPSLIATFFAASVHPTAILMLANVLFINKKITKKAALFSALSVSFLIVFSLLDLINLLASMSDAINRYVWYFYWDRVNPWRIKHIYYGIFLLVITLFIFKNRISWEVQRVLLFIVYGIVLLLLFKGEEMVADRIFLYFIPIIPFLLYYAVTRFNPNRYAVLALAIASNAWLLKTMFYQYPGWFIPPFESVRL